MDQKAHVGAKAIANLVPTDSAKSSTDASDGITGMATFSETASSVDMMFSLGGCRGDTMYSVIIQAGSDCSDASLQGPHWERSGDLPMPGCAGVSSRGRFYFSRDKSEPQPWTIGTPAASNLLGHVLVVYDASSMAPLACGPIMREEDVALSTPAERAAGPSVQLRAAIGGMCTAKMLVRDNQQDCPKPAEVDKCATEHCELDACIAQCKDYLACLEAAPDDPCSRAFTCEISSECSTCTGQAFSCAFGFCPDVLACAAPVTPDGPCSKLEACCALQGDRADSCLETVHLLERLSGDPSCFGAMHDWDAVGHLNVPCKFE